MNDIPRPIPNAYWVIPGKFLAGEYPGSFTPQLTHERLQAFLEAGITTFIDLTWDGELPPYAGILSEQAGIYDLQVHHHRFAIGDFGLPSPAQMSATLDVIDQILAAGGRLYLHCQAGIGRTGTTVGCYLVRHGLSGEQALQQLAAWWQAVPKSALSPFSPETEAQAEFVRTWQEPPLPPV
jgi:hypothetical protein